MPDREEWLAQFRCYLLDCAGRFPKAQRTFAKALEGWAETIETIADPQIEQFDLAEREVTEDRFDYAFRAAVAEGWSDHKAKTASEFLAILTRRLERRH